MKHRGMAVLLLAIAAFALTGLTAQLEAATAQKQSFSIFQPNKKKTQTAAAQAERLQESFRLPVRQRAADAHRFGLPLRVRRPQSPAAGCL